MLGTIIEKLSSLLSKAALLTSFIPLLAFVMSNGGLLAAVYSPFRVWAAAQGNPESISAGVVLFLVASLIFATLNTRLREVMEGHFWPTKMQGWFIAAQQSRLDALDSRYSQLQKSRFEIPRSTPNKWTERLKAARASKDQNVGAIYEPRGPAALAMRTLVEKRRHGGVIAAAELIRALDLLENELRVARVSPELDRAQQEFLKLIDYARAKNDNEIIICFNERQFNFPGQVINQQLNAPSRVLAPTAMGNVALSIRSYGLSRYGLDIERVWTRLQKVLQGEAFYGILQDAKMQLDFLVSLFWLAGLATAAWLVLLGLFGYSLRLYLMLALAGSLSVWVFYRLALQNYRAFADLMRSAVDLYRLRLLEELHLALPKGSTEEAALWQALQNRMEYGKDIHFSYRRTGP